jgi:hypothetical protein
MTFDMTKASISRPVAALMLLLSCACTKASLAPEQTRAHTATRANAATAANAATRANAPAAERFCEEFRSEEAQIQASEETRTLRWPTALPGMAPLERHAAPTALTRALLGAPCHGGDDLWVVPVARLTGHLVNVEQEFVAVRGPSIALLGNGRTAFFAIASEGHYHAADAFGLIAVVDDDDPGSTPLFAMPGSGTWGEVGGFNIAAGEGAIWSAAGDFSFGDAQGWAGVTDVSAPAPHASGRFLTYGRHTCLTSDASPGSWCRGAWEYTITSIVYRPDGLLTLTWRLDNFDERRVGAGDASQRRRQTTRLLSASYQMDGQSYRRRSGEEPPSIE